jgi:hypothetical protein
MFPRRPSLERLVPYSPRSTTDVTKPWSVITRRLVSLCSALRRLPLVILPFGFGYHKLYIHQGLRALTTNRDAEERKGREAVGS